MLTRAQMNRLDAVLAAARQRLPEIRRPLTSAGLKAALRREGILVKALPHPRDAELLAIEGRWVIIVDERKPHRERLIAAAHEYAHYLAHVDPSEAVAFDRSPPWYDAQREAEADYVAELLIRGPVRPSPEVPAVRTNARRGRAARRTDPDQLALDGTEELVSRSRDASSPATCEQKSEIEPPVTAKTKNAQGLPAEADRRPYEQRIVRRGAKKMAARVIDRTTPDDERIEWGNGTRPTRFLELDGHRWSIYNARIAIVDGRAKMELVRDFMDRRATHRIFVDAAGTRRVYRFVPRELRAYKVKHLERQLAAATAWPRRTVRASQSKAAV